MNHSSSYRNDLNENKSIDKIPALKQLIGDPVAKCTLEADCVRIADKISTCVHDLADAYQLRLIKEHDLEEIKKIIKFNGKITSNFGEKLENYLIDVVDNFLKDDGNDILKEYEREIKYTILNKYKNIMNDKVYKSPDVVISDNRAIHILRKLFTYYIEEEKIIREIQKAGGKEEKIFHKVHRNIYEIEWLFGLDWPRIITNFLASMTDRYCNNLHQKLFH